MDGSQNKWRQNITDWKRTGNVQNKKTSMRIKRNGDDQNLKEVKCCNVQTEKWMMWNK